MAEFPEVKMEPPPESHTLAQVPSIVEAPAQLEATAPATATAMALSTTIAIGPALAPAGFNLNNLPQPGDHTLAPAAVQLQAQDLALTESPDADTEASSANRIPEHLMHKNHLQAFTQRFSLPFPVYQNTNEGFQHSPKFRSTVIVNGETYTSPNTFSHRKAAEQEVAKFALDSILKKVHDKALSLIREDTVFCKLILNEFAIKMNLELPVYNNFQSEVHPPIFKSSVVFDNAVYTGKTGVNKKEAEQLAARAVILSLLGTSGARTILSDIIVSKYRHFAVVHNGNADGSSDVVQTATMNHDMPAGAAREANPGTHLPPFHQFMKPRSESLFATENLPITFVGASSGSKRRKNKKKANKKLRIDGKLAVGPPPSSEGPPCSVAQ